MQIVCPNCQNSYEVAAASLGEGGRSVRCVRCREVWFATPTPDPDAPGEMPTVSPFAASAQYQKGAGGMQAEPPSGPTPDQPPEDDVSVDANLAARAAGRLSGRPGDDADDAASTTGAGEDWPPMTHDAPPLAPDDASDAAIAAAVSAAPGEDIESIAARRARRQAAGKPERAPRSPLPVLIAVLFAVNAALLGWRGDVVRLMPQTASLYAAIGLPVNLRGLAFSEVATTKEMHEGVPVLLVQGTITNVSRTPLEVPRIRIAMRNTGGSEVYSWTTLPGRAILPPGEAQPFQSRLASPPADGRDVVVRFFTRRDAAAGMR